MLLGDIIIGLLTAVIGLFGITTLGKGGIDANTLRDALRDLLRRKKSVADGPRTTSSSSDKRLKAARKSATNTDTEIPDGLEAQIDKLKKGLLKLDYHSPMRAGDTQSLSVIVGTEEAKAAIEEIASDLTAPIEEIRIYTYMSTAVRGSAFKVQPQDTDPEQIVHGDKPSVWKYDVTALASGEQELEVYVYARFARHDVNKQERYLLEVAKKVISVDVNYQYSFVKFVTDRDKTFWGIVIFGIVGFLLWIIGLDSVTHWIDDGVRRILHLPAPPKK